MTITERRCSSQRWLGCSRDEALMLQKGQPPDWSHAVTGRRHRLGSRCRGIFCQSIQGAPVLLEEVQEDLCLQVLHGNASN